MNARRASACCSPPLFLKSCNILRSVSYTMYPNVLILSTGSCCSSDMLELSSFIRMCHHANKLRAAVRSCVGGISTPSCWTSCDGFFATITKLFCLLTIRRNWTGITALGPDPTTAWFTTYVVLICRGFCPPLFIAFPCGTQDITYESVYLVGGAVVLTPKLLAHVLAVCGASIYSLQSKCAVPSLRLITTT